MKLLLRLLILAFHLEVTWAESFLSTTTPLSPFIEQNVLGSLSPSVLLSSSALYGNRAFSAFTPYNDYSFAYRPIDLPDVFNAGFSFNQALGNTVFLSGSAQIYLLGSLQNISEAIFNKLNDFAYLNLAPSLTFKLAPVLAWSLDSDLSLYSVNGEKVLDANVSSSVAFEFKTPSLLINAIDVGLTGRNFLGLLNPSNTPFDAIGSLSLSTEHRFFTLGAAVNYRPMIGAATESSLTFDLGTSLYFFKALRLNVGLVGVGQTEPSLNVSTSLDVYLIRFSYGLQNILPSSGNSLRGGGLDQSLGISFFFKLTNTPSSKMLSETFRQSFREKLDRLGEHGRSQFVAKTYLAARDTFKEMLLQDPQNEMAQKYLTLLTPLLEERRVKAVQKYTQYIKLKKYVESFEWVFQASLIAPEDREIQKSRQLVFNRISKRFETSDDFLLFCSAIQLGLDGQEKSALIVLKTLPDVSEDNDVLRYYWFEFQNRTLGMSTPIR